ncbi:MAG: hypothetical protein K5668_06180 [Lachnospiraceae bacterium]|nr:hypothetical protein [Lachnospiraceae bacterium]
MPEQEFSLKDGKANLNYYMPITDNGKAIGLIELSLDWTKNVKAIWRNSAQVELVNLVVLLIVAVLILASVNRLAVRPLKTVQKNVRY